MKKVTVFFLLLAFFACKQADRPVAHVDLAKALSQGEKPVSLGEISSDIQVIPLETRDDLLMQRISLVRLHGDKLIVYYDNMCALFDLTGKWIRNIGSRGEGPGEFMYLSDVWVEDDGYTLVESRTGKLMKYDLEGNFVKTTRSRNDYYQVIRIGKGLYAAFNRNLSGMEQTKIVFLDADMAPVDSIPYTQTYEKENPAAIGGYGSEGGFFQNGRGYGFKEAYVDTVYRLMPDLKMQVEYIVDMGNYTFTPELRHLLLSPRDPQLADKRTTVVVFENARYTIFRGYRYQKESMLWDRQTGKITLAALQYPEDILKQLDKEDAAFVPQFVSDDNQYLIAVEEATSIDNDNNPSIVLVKMDK